MNFIERLDSLLKKNGLNKNQLSSQTGIPVSTVYGWYKKGYEGITLPTIKKLADYFNCSIEYLVNGEEEKKSFNKDLSVLLHPIKDVKTRRVPLIGSVAAGTPILAEEDYESFVAAPGKADYALRVEGHSMAPKYMDGDIVYIRCQPDVDDGQVAVILIDDSATLKNVYHVDGGLLLLPENAAFPAMRISASEVSSLRILGTVVGFTRIY